MGNIHEKVIRVGEKTHKEIKLKAVDLNISMGEFIEALISLDVSPEMLRELIVRAKGIEKEDGMSLKEARYELFRKDV